MSNEKASRGKSWDENEVRLCLNYIQAIKAESRGRGVSFKSPSLLELHNQLPSRTLMSVGAKVRGLMQKYGMIKAKKTANQELHVEIAELKAQRNLWGLKAAVDPEPTEQWAEEAPAPSNHVVSIPLKNLYGKVDFETFISLVK